VHIIFTRYVCDLFAKLHGLIITYFAQETDSCFCGCVMYGDHLLVSVERYSTVSLMRGVEDSSLESGSAH